MNWIHCFKIHWSQHLFCRSLLPFSYQCVNEACKKQNDKNGISFGECKLTCRESGVLWPRPTGRIYLSSSVFALDLLNLKLNNVVSVNSAVKALIDEAFAIFLNNVKGAHPANKLSSAVNLKSVKLDIIVAAPNILLNFDSDESYTLVVTTSQLQCTVKIIASSFLVLAMVLKL